MIDAYEEGIQILETGDGLLAAKKFSEAEFYFTINLGTKISINGCIFLLYK